MLADEALVAQHDALVAAHAAAKVAGPPDGGAPQAHALAEVGVVVDDDALEVGVGPHPDVRAEHRVGPEAHARLDPAVLTDHGGAHDLGLGVDLGALADVHAVADLEAGDVELHPTVEDVLVGTEVRLERADVLPVALADAAEDRRLGLEQRREHLRGEVDGATGLDVVEDLAARARRCRR